MLGRLFNKMRKPAAQLLIAQLNARLQPIHRGEIFEDPLDAALKEASRGEVSGGGTLQVETGEIEYCDLEIQLRGPLPEGVRFIIEKLEHLGAPKGSKLLVESESREVPFGRAEGLAVYLNGTDLPAQVYQECDSNFVHSEFNRLLEGHGRVFSFWQGPRETALYAYGTSFREMQNRIAGLTSSYPLCERCRIVQIA